MELLRAPRCSRRRRLSPGGESGQSQLPRAAPLQLFSVPPRSPVSQAPRAKYSRPPRGPSAAFAEQMDGPMRAQGKERMVQRPEYDQAEDYGPGGARWGPRRMGGQLDGQEQDGQYVDQGGPQVAGR